MHWLPLYGSQTAADIWFPVFLGLQLFFVAVAVVRRLDPDALRGLRLSLLSWPVWLRRAYFVFVAFGLVGAFVHP